MPKFQQRSAWWWVAGATAACIATGLWLGGTSMAAARFDKPITIVVTFPPGGGTDLLARKLGTALQQRIGQSVVVENRPGASGNIGARHVAEAAGDGATLLMVNSSFAINPAVYRQLDFDPRQDFKAVFNVGTIASVLVVPQASALHSLADARASAQQQDLPFASCGNGTPQHMAGEMLAQAAQMHLQHVPYKGCGPAITAVADPAGRQPESRRQRVSAWRETVAAPGPRSQTPARPTRLRRTSQFAQIFSWSLPEVVIKKRSWQRKLCLIFKYKTA